jgi:hypothetical protein
MTALYDRLLSDLTAERFFLVEITGFDIAAGQEKTEYFADADYTTRPTDSAPNRYYDGRLNSGFTFKRELFGEQRIGGRSTPGYGALSLNNEDGALDRLQGWSFFGRSIVVRLGARRYRGERFPFADFGVVFSGTCEAVEFQESEVIFRLRSLDWLLDSPLLKNTYAGTGGLEGGAALKGKRKPLSLGHVLDVPPVYLGIIDGLYTYQVSDPAVGAIGDIPQAYDGAAALTKVTGTPTGGQYRVNTTNCTLQLASAITLALTANVIGVGGLTAGSIARFIVDDIAGITAINEASITALNTLQPATVGLYAALDERTMADGLDWIINSIGGFWGFNRPGLFSVGRLDAPLPLASAAQIFDKTTTLALERIATPVPAWKVTVGHAPAYLTLGENQIAGGVSEERKQFILQRYRTGTPWESSTVKTIHKNAADLRFDTGIVDTDDADEEATRLGGLLGVPREMYQALAKALPFQLDLGETIGLQDERFELDEGKSFVIVGMEENSGDNEIQLLVYG